MAALFCGFVVRFFMELRAGVSVADGRFKMSGAVCLRFTGQDYRTNTCCSSKG